MSASSPNSSERTVLTYVKPNSTYDDIVDSTTQALNYLGATSHNPSSLSLLSRPPFLRSSLKIDAAC